jgi:hypothetical protein
MHTLTNAVMTPIWCTRPLTLVGRVAIAMPLHLILIWPPLYRISSASPSFGCSLLRVVCPAQHGLLDSTPLLVCFCSWQPSTILVCSLGDWAGILTHKHSFSGCGLHTQPHSSTSSMWSFSCALTSIPHQDSVTLPLAIIWGDSRGYAPGHQSSNSSSTCHNSWCSKSTDV